MFQKTKDNVQDTFNETVEDILTEHSNIGTKDAEEMAYEELKPGYACMLLQNFYWTSRGTAERSRALENYSHGKTTAG